MSSSLEMITISKGDPGFDKYLLGSYSDQTRALPVSSMNVNSNLETITFKLVSKSEIKRPLFYFLGLIKPRLMLLLLIPIFTIFTLAHSRGLVIDPLLPIFSAISILLAGVAVSLMNDFSDHMNGIDRLLPKELYRPIQKGWVSAWNVKVLSYFFIGLSFLFVVPIFFIYPFLLIYFLGTLILGVYAQFRNDQSFKHQRFGEVVLFILLGPVLSMGFMSSISGLVIDVQSIWFGLFWGVFSLHLIHVQNFETLLVNSQAGVVNTTTVLGFDRSKMLLFGSWIFIGVLYALLELNWGTKRIFMFWCFLFLITVPLLFRALKNSKSPLGSCKSLVCRLSYYLIILAEIFFFTRSLSYWYE